MIEHKFLKKNRKLNLKVIKKYNTSRPRLCTDVTILIYDILKKIIRIRMYLQTFINTLKELIRIRMSLQTSFTDFCQSLKKTSID